MSRSYPQTVLSKYPGKLRNLSCFVFGVILTFHLMEAQPAFGQSAPKLVSATPADGAKDVPIDSSLVFVFDQNMDDGVIPVPSFAPAFIGNYELTPGGTIFSGTWSADKRTLTMQATAPFAPNTTYTWKLNPAGGLFPFSSESGQPLATVSGSFTTAGGGGGGTGPLVLSVTPPNNSTNVPPNTPLIFTFNADMDTNVVPTQSVGTLFVGNYEFNPGDVSFSGEWGADKRTLTLTPLAPLRSELTLTWTLNPATTMLPFKSSAGQSLATTTGSFKTAHRSGANTNELCDTPESPLLGSYILSKIVSYEQNSANPPTARDELPAALTSLVQGPGVTEASLTLPNGTRQNLQQILSFFILTFSTNESALEASYPAGAYTLRFSQTNQSERVIPMNVPGLPASVPTIVNFDQAQNIEATAPFTLQWNALTPLTAQSSLFLSISDEEGNIRFLAPNPCIPRELPPSATSIVLPANTLEPGMSYKGSLDFAVNFYRSTNDVPEFGGFGSVLRSTEFTLKTTGGSTGTVQPAKFTGFRMLGNGHPEMDLTGSAGKAYTVQRASAVVNAAWEPAGTVTMTAAGTAKFEDVSSALTLPVFYRAVGN